MVGCGKVLRPPFPRRRLAGRAPGAIIRAMSRPSSPASTSASDDPWGRILGRIIQGFAHDLNNRLLVLMGVRDLLEPAAGADAGLLELFDGELDGLERDVRLLRRLDAGEDAIETVDPGDLLTATRALHRQHRGLQAVEVEWRIPVGLPAVAARPSAALQALLLMLAASAETALEAGAREASVEARAGGGAVVVGLTPAVPASHPYLEAVGARLEGEWAVLTVSSTSCSLSLKAVHG